MPRSGRAAAASAGAGRARLGLWRGSYHIGILHLAWEHIQIAAISVFFGALIGLAVGITLGHFRRGAALVTLLANVTRAVPTKAFSSSTVP